MCHHQNKIKLTYDDGGDDDDGDDDDDDDDDDDASMCHNDICDACCVQVVSI
jgi:hypothetical protein